VGGGDHVVATNNKIKYVNESFEKLLVIRKEGGSKKKAMGHGKCLRNSSYLDDVVTKPFFLFFFGLLLGKVGNLKPKPYHKCDL